MWSCRSCCCLCTNRWTPGGWPCSSPGPPGPDCLSLSFIPGTTCQDGWKHSGVARRGRASAQHSSLTSTFTSLFPTWAESSLGESQNRLPAQGSGLQQPPQTEAGETGGVRGQAQAQARLGGKMAGWGSELISRSVFLPLPPTFPSGHAAASVLSFELCFTPGVGEQSPAV